MSSVSWAQRPNTTISTNAHGVTTEKDTYGTPVTYVVSCLSDRHAYIFERKPDNGFQIHKTMDPGAFARGDSDEAVYLGDCDANLFYLASSGRMPAAVPVEVRNKLIQLLSPGAQTAPGMNSSTPFGYGSDQFDRK